MPLFTIGIIKINALQYASNFSIGYNVQIGIRSDNKMNQGQLSFGDNGIGPTSAALISDPDVIDHPVADAGEFNRVPIPIAKVP